MPGERRKQKRVPVLFDVILEGAAGKYQTRTSDLSASGCYIDSIAQVNIGEVIKLRLRLPSGEWMDLKGEVAYNNYLSGFGLRFIEVSDFDRKRLEWLVKAESHRRDKQS